MPITLSTFLIMVFQVSGLLANIHWLVYLAGIVLAEEFVGMKGFSPLPQRAPIKDTGLLLYSKLSAAGSCASSCRMT